MVWGVTSEIRYYRIFQTVLTEAGEMERHRASHICELPLSNPPPTQGLPLCLTSSSLPLTEELHPQPVSTLILLEPFKERDRETLYIHVHAIILEQSNQHMVGAQKLLALFFLMIQGTHEFEKRDFLNFFSWS